MYYLSVPFKTLLGSIDLSMPSFSSGDWQLLSRVQCACTRACWHPSLSLHRAAGAISVPIGDRAHSGVDGMQLGSTSTTPAHSSGKLGRQGVTGCSWPAFNFVVVDSQNVLASFARGFVACSYFQEMNGYQLGGNMKWGPICPQYRFSFQSVVQFD